MTLHEEQRRARWLAKRERESERESEMAENGDSVGLQEPSAECGDHDGFWLPGHLQILDQEDGHGEEGDIGNDVDGADGFPALELGGRRMVSRDRAWRLGSVTSDLPDYCILNPMDIQPKSAEQTSEPIWMIGRVLSKPPICVVELARGGDRGIQPRTL
jgi:hypothetical protein